MTGEPALNRRLVLESRQDMSDGMGGFTVSWVPQGAHWAQVKIQSGRESRIAGRDVSSVTYRITVRASAPGTPSRPRPDQRFREFERVFAIHAVAEAGADGRYLDCWTEEGRA